MKLTIIDKKKVEKQWKNFKQKMSEYWVVFEREKKLSFLIRRYFLHKKRGKKRKLQCEREN